MGLPAVHPVLHKMHTVSRKVCPFDPSGGERKGRTPASIVIK